MSSDQDGEGFDYDPEYDKNTVEPLDPKADFYLEPAKRRELRLAFLKAIEESAPNVLQRLRERVYRLCTPTRCRERHGESPLSNWAVSFRLYDPDSAAGSWIMKAAMRTLKYWDEHPEATECSTWRWSTDAADVELDDWDSFAPPSGREVEHVRSMLDSPFRFECASWNPPQETRAEYSRRTKEEFAKALEEELRKIDKALRKPWRQSAPEKRAGHHCRWLVEYQINKWRPSTIATNHQEVTGGRVDEQTVRDAVHGTAMLLFGERWELWRRPKSPPGRPPSHRDPKPTPSHHDPKPADDLDDEDD